MDNKLTVNNSLLDHVDYAFAFRVVSGEEPSVLFLGNLLDYGFRLCASFVHYYLAHRLLKGCAQDLNA